MEPGIKAGVTVASDSVIRTKDSGYRKTKKATGSRECNSGDDRIRTDDVMRQLLVSNENWMRYPQLDYISDMDGMF